MRPKFLGSTPFGGLGALFSFFNPEAQDAQDRMKAPEPFPDKVEPAPPSERSQPVLVVDNEGTGSVDPG